MRKKPNDIVLNRDEKILFLIPSGLGDFIKSLGIFRAIKERYPEKTLDVAVVNNEAKILKEFISYVDGIVTLGLNRYTARSYISYFLLSAWKDIAKINSGKYDLIVGLTLNPLRKYLLYFSRAKNRLSLNNPETDTIQEYDYIFKTFRVNMEPFQSPLFDKEIESDDVNTSYLESLLSSNKKNIIVNMFCTDSPRSLRDWNKWSLLLEQLKNKFNIILVGRVNFDYKQHYRIVDSNIVDLINKLDLRSLVHLFKICDLVISVDSFPFHLAYAVGTPVIGLFGPINPRIRIPPNIDNAGIFCIFYNAQNFINGSLLKRELHKKKRGCIFMDSIKVKDVVNMVNTALGLEN